MEMAEGAVPELAGGGGKGQGTNMLNTDQLLARATMERPRQSTEPLVPGTATRLFKLLSSISPEEQVREVGTAGEPPTAQGHLRPREAGAGRGSRGTRSLELRSR